jgi:hypothetical protein
MAVLRIENALVDGARIGRDVGRWGQPFSAAELCEEVHLFSPRPAGRVRERGLKLCRQAQGRHCSCFDERRANERKSRMKIKIRKRIKSQRTRKIMTQ